MYKPAPMEHINTERPIIPARATTGETFLCDEFLDTDEDVIKDFFDYFSQACEEIDLCLTRLKSVYRKDEIHAMFRTLHSLKGNCQLMFLTPFVPVLTALEDIAGELREQRYDYESWMGDFILLVVEELERQIQSLSAHRRGDQTRLTWISQMVIHVRDCNTQERSRAYAHGLAALRREQEDADSAAPDTSPALTPLPSLPPDTVLMRGWAHMSDNISFFRQGRTQQLMPMAELLNSFLGNPVEISQLRAAVWMHDVGMAFIPQTIVSSSNSLSREERRSLQQHPLVGYQWLKRMGGWDEAAEIVLQHHEHLDGSGYPDQRRGDAIHIGGRLLSVLDTFCSVTSERADRNYRKGVLSAVTEINLHSGSQFDPLVVSQFNEMIRRHFLKR